MEIKFTTSKLSIAILGYIQKIIATILAIAFCVFYLKSAVMHSTGLGDTISVILLIVLALVFELILHVGLSSFVEGLAKMELRVIDFVGAFLCFVIIFYVSWHSTTDITFAKKEMKKQGFLSLDSLRNTHNNILKTTTKEFEQKEKTLENTHLPALGNMQNHTWAYLSALKSYENAKDFLAKEKEKTLLKLEKQQNEILTHTKSTNDKIEKEILAQQTQNNNKASWLGLIVLVFSIFSTIMVGAYVPSKNIQIEECTTPQTTTPQNTTNINIVVQNEVQLQPEVQNLVQSEEVQYAEVQDVKVEEDIEIDQPQETIPTPALVEAAEILDLGEIEIQEKPMLKIENKKLSQGRILATEYMQTEEYKALQLTEEKKFEFLKQRFDISWGTFYNIKRDLKNIQIS